ncbi:transglycosylase SLT domain-containing protein [Sphingomonas donggukensis]|uniref:Transglycosylase SLT domain-containing protein n=1 Tax=Sphingomonas donggukensis TaxID=2949093 RepID=A0ABY4TUC1_9SPHN|nr:transglycosylase SLT domain-containing protein [Sphingomonas donggukensis]URW75877.1 transglycosylase SLT domain-containing protein [Sphingomonas donggukensis]
MKRVPSRRQCVLVVALILLSARPLAAAATAPDEQSDRLRTVAAAVDEASRHFGIPVEWIWAIVRAESGGDARAVSSAGAMGLMQIMPATYADLRRRHGLGADPFAVRDNVLAGTAYLRALHDRFGAYGMLAAYNAGPGRWEDHLATGRPLPGETQRYLARLSPVIAPGAAGVPVQPLGTPRLSPFAAPIFVARTTVALPIIASTTRARTTAEAQPTVGAAAPPDVNASPNPSGKTAPRVDLIRSVSPRSDTLFVESSSGGASR